MGVVYRAEDTSFYNRFVAIKFLYPQLSGNHEAIARFQQYAMAAANIQHPNIANLFDVGTAPEGDAYYVTEFLEGETLAHRLETEHQLPVPLAVEIAVQTAGGLARAHEDNIFHWDLKPANIYLAGDRDSPTVKILDFGCAKLLAPPTPGRLTLPAPGTSQYTATEQLKPESNAAIDGRVDIYALGVILYEMLCGKAPFADRESIKDAPDQASIPPPRSLCPSLPSDLERVILSCLEADPNRRIDAMKNLISALEPFRRASTGTVVLDRQEPFEQVPRAHTTWRRVVDQPVPVPVLPKKSRRTLLFAAVGVGVVSIAVVVVVAVEKKHPPAAPPVPTEAEIRIDSTPSDAEVLVANRTLGRTPLPIKWPRSAGRVQTFEVRKGGHLPQRVDVELDKNARVHVVLAPEQRPR